MSRIKERCNKNKEKKKKILKIHRKNYDHNTINIMRKILIIQIQ